MPVENNKSSNFELDVLSIANKLKDINKKESLKPEGNNFENNNNLKK